MGNKPWREMTPEQQAAHYERTRRWRASAKGRKARREENRRYRAEHPAFVEAQKEYHREYYQLYRRKMLDENRNRYRRKRAAILAQQGEYRKRKRAAIAAEERAIIGTMAAIEADAVRTFLPDNDVLGIHLTTKRLGKRGHGRTHTETVAMRLAARKGEPLPPEPIPAALIIGKRPYHGFADGQWQRKKRGDG